MNKVMCINDRHWKNDVPCPKFGEITTVSNVEDDLYEFMEYGEANWYSQKYFAPLSDIDETELVTEEFNEKYCVPV
ncbi:MAG TPA: hypothetical protein VF008_09790 [Niastella sp.]